MQLDMETDQEILNYIWEDLSTTTDQGIRTALYPTLGKLLAFISPNTNQTVQRLTLVSPEKTDADEETSPWLCTRSTYLCRSRSGKEWGRWHTTPQPV